MKAEESRLAGLARALLSRCGARCEQADVEDVMQETYLKVAEKLETEDIKNPVGFYRRTLLFKCREASRHSRSKLAVQLAEEDDMLDLVGSRNAPMELRVALIEGLDRLPEDDCHVIRMSEEGYTADQIAKTMGPGVTPEMVRQKKSRALIRLRNLLGGTKAWAM